MGLLLQVGPKKTFFMICNAVNTVKYLIIIFERNGLTEIQSKNFSVITKLLITNVFSLDEFDALSEDTYKDVLNGFTKFRNSF